MGGRLFLCPGAAGSSPENLERRSCQRSRSAESFLSPRQVQQRGTIGRLHQANGSRRLSLGLPSALMIRHRGGCHCGRVRFEVTAPADIDALECNCSICSKLGFVHLIVPAARFRLLQGDDCLSTYTFNSGVAKHLFCKICGVKSFYVPRSNPDGYSVNVRCLDRGTVERVRITQFDGEHWENRAGELAELSK